MVGCTNGTVSGDLYEAANATEAMALLDSWTKRDVTTS